MARKTRPTAPTPVEVIRHDEKRTNIPTADAAGHFYDEAADRLPPVPFERRDVSRDPQLVWRGKDAQDAAELLVDAPPIYIQEKIAPQALIENLRRTAVAGEPEPELTLWESFDGLDELSQVEFYQHQANWSNRMILGDSLQVMASLAEREQLRGQVQMIYIDPPYGIKFGSNWQVSARKRDVKDGKLEDAAREAEQIKAFRDTWELGIHSYLSYLRDRLVAARDLLTDSGSIFVQIGDENVHLVRSLMDEVFGSDRFVAEISYVTTTGRGSVSLDRVLDKIIWYAKNYSEDKANNGAKIRPLYVDKDWGSAQIYADQDGRQYSLRDSSSQDETATGRFPFEFEGVTFTPPPGRHWSTTEAGLRNAELAGRLVNVGGKQLRVKRYLDEVVGTRLTNLWTDTQRGAFSESKFYIVQTADRVIERCMLMCTDPGDLVLDPTCGSGTTTFVAEQWGRRWITVDTSRVALALARQRLMGGKFPYYLLADSTEGRAKEQQITQKALPPIETRGDIRHGFVYERVQHITLKSIANNPDIHEGMSREEIDAAIKRHAEFELLYDKPYEDKKRVRVTGPFTVESLSPHRSLTFDDPEEAAERETISQSTVATGTEGADFESSILDNLLRAGVQNGRRNERIEFASLDAHAGTYVQAIGERRIRDAVESAAVGEATARNEGTAASPSRIAVAIGPQYGTVSPAFIKQAAKEALADENVDLLCVLGFAFDPQATGVTEADGITVEAGDDGFANVEGERRLGRIKVLLVRMNVDLLMSGELKKTAAANLFTVFGEPDLEVRPTADDRLEVELFGVDVYDPTTGEVRSRQTDRIALWMIDTDYDEESFFVRHCYFTGGIDPYKKLKTALRADIDPEGWASLYRTVSMAFDHPSSGKIAIKVINDYGDEVMKVFTV